MTKEKYLSNHLLSMDEPTRQRYIRMMETYTAVDYDNMTKNILTQMGEPSEELLAEVKKFLKDRYGITRDF